MIEFICDECEKRAEGSFDQDGKLLKPKRWIKATIEKEVITACSLECFKSVLEKSEVDIFGGVK